MVNKDECWLWAGNLYSSGHGLLYIGYDKDNYKNMTIAAHTAVYESEVGPVPEGLELDHLCENPPCVNPAHLEPVTHRENTLRHYRNRTHCRRGHAYAGGVYWRKQKSNISEANPTGLSRYCLECRRAGFRRTKARRSVRK